MCSQLWLRVAAGGRAAAGDDPGRQTTRMRRDLSRPREPDFLPLRMVDDVLQRLAQLDEAKRLTHDEVCSETPHTSGYLSEYSSSASNWSTIIRPKSVADCIRLSMAGLSLISIG